MGTLTRRISSLHIPKFPISAVNSRLVKYLLFLVFLANIRSWPFAWHVQVFFPAIKIRLAWTLVRLRVLFKPKAVKDQAKARWLRNLSCVGVNPFELRDSWKNWASLDDCDYNLHLSNSCYAKNLDTCRLQFVLKAFPTMFRAGGWMALGGTHFNFLREIPILSQYECRSSIAGWDNKWLYVVIRFVSHSRKKSKSKTNEESSPQSDAVDTRADAAPYPVLHMPVVLDKSQDSSAAPSALASPPSLDPSSTNGSVTGTQASLDSHARAVSAALRPGTHVESDGATLHCVAISAICFKIGRITIPPALALVCEGLSVGPEAGIEDAPAPAPYSRANPPPFWSRVEELRGTEINLSRLRAFYAGGWREVPEGERWWESALGGEVEKRRAAGMQIAGSLRRGMEGMQSL